MNIGILVHSLTGNTYSVMEKLAEQCKAKRHTVSIDRLSVKGGEDTNLADIQKIELEVLPDIRPYDFIVFAGPVRGFSQSPVIAKCFSLLSSYPGKRVACLVTQQFPHPWMGGNRTISQMKKQCDDKGYKVCASGIVNWKSKERDRKITDAINAILNAL